MTVVTTKETLCDITFNNNDDQYEEQTPHSNSPEFHKPEKRRKTAPQCEGKKIPLSSEELELQEIKRKRELKAKENEQNKRFYMKSIHGTTTVSGKASV